MRIKIVTAVQQDVQSVIKGFDRDLFLALKPTLVPIHLLRFDGCKTGDEVHLNLGLGQKWISVITHSEETGTGMTFIDEGRQLPFFLTSWHHVHSIEVNPNNEGTLISDNITYSSKSKLLEWMLYPILYAQFAWRIPVYKRFFGKTQG